MTNGLASLAAAAIACVVLGGGCAPEDHGAREPIGSANCFSPTQSPALSLNDSGAGCPCSGSAAVCVRTEHDGRPWDVALSCEAGRWVGVEDGPCWTSPDPPAQCLVEGQLYSDDQQVPDPYSCNSCFCENGQVTVCTEIGCAEACPAGTTPGTSCALCGPTDACDAVETTCLRTCASAGECTDPAHPVCTGGQCRNVCG